ncbi:amidohydrolase [Lutispora thermophila]|uniref:Aminobenzoyl-glutamate utilization protein A n=1 Tax=Lutispora thermophila DSM 19022 TaxID=1122184 RepID=A0A1M6E7T2_9FIRM|nr:amidohydrolase [Lutispora thermophila]SHI81439.1 aminobenzoyl-glutamate utilization protein A [Lutispora thermophila DSM 19022]
MDNKYQKLIDWRREFHKCAETGWLEFETTIKIIKYLRYFGYEVKYGKEIHGERMGLPDMDIIRKHRETIKEDADFDISEILDGYTGAVAILDTHKEGPVIAMRFDIDANAIEESKDEDHRPNREGFASRNTNAMHACGHDGHIALGLAVAEELVKEKHHLSGKFILIFQPAEEGVRGAKSIVESGMLKDVDYLISGHIGLGAEKNEVVCGTTGFLATSKLDIYFEGKPAHAGANPEAGKNALLAACSCALNLHTLTQFGSGMSRLNVGVLKAGTARNIVPHKAYMEIETRGENEDVNSLLLQKVHYIIEGSAKSFDVKFKIVESGGAPAYNNCDKNFIDELIQVLTKKNIKVTTGKSLGASEDITHMMNEVEKNRGKSVYLMFGTKLAAPHHHNRFDFDESVLSLAYDAFLEIIRSLL